MPTPEKALHDLLVALFTVEQLRRFLIHECEPALESALPSGPVSLDDFAFEATQELRRSRLIAAPLFAALAARTPAAHDEIAGVARMFRVGPPIRAAPPPVAPPPPLSPAPEPALPPPESAPLAIVLEFVRSRDAGHAHAFQFTPQVYALRSPGGAFAHAEFPWTPELLADLRLVRTPGCPPEVHHRLGTVLRGFLDAAGWSRHEHAIAAAARAGRYVHLTIRSAAAELYAVPWELVVLKSTGQSIGGMPQVLVRHEWPDDSASAPDRIPAGLRRGRTVVAWSAAGGAVPAGEHLAALADAFVGRPDAFDPARDVVAHATLAGLHRALDDAARGGPPIDALHVLCHGAQIAASYGLALDDDACAGQPAFVDAGRLQQVIAPYAGMLRLVILCVCDSGDGELGGHLGSVAQMLHRVGVRAVLGSRAPLSARGSIACARGLFGALVGGRLSLERAVLAARAALLLDPTHNDWVALQLYSREADGEGSFPLALTTPTR